MGCTGLQGSSVFFSDRVKSDLSNDASLVAIHALCKKVFGRSKSALKTTENDESANCQDIHMFLQEFDLLVPGGSYGAPDAHPTPAQLA